MVNYPDAKGRKESTVVYTTILVWKCFPACSGSDSPKYIVHIIQQNRSIPSLKCGAWSSIPPTWHVEETRMMHHSAAAAERFSTYGSCLPLPNKLAGVVEDEKIKYCSVWVLLGCTKTWGLLLSDVLKCGGIIMWPYTRVRWYNTFYQKLQS